MTAVVFSVAPSFLSIAHDLWLLWVKFVDSNNSFQCFRRAVSRGSISAYTTSGFPVLLCSFRSLSVSVVQQGVSVLRKLLAAERRWCTNSAYWAGTSGISSILDSAYLVKAVQSAFHEVPVWFWLGVHQRDLDTNVNNSGVMLAFWKGNENSSQCHH